VDDNQAKDANSKKEVVRRRDHNKDVAEQRGKFLKEEHIPSQRSKKLTLWVIKKGKILGGHVIQVLEHQERDLGTLTGKNPD